TGVTCLTCVNPSGSWDTSPPFLAEINFQVPTSLLSALVSRFGASSAASSKLAPSVQNSNAQPPRASIVMVILRCPRTIGRTPVTSPTALWTSSLSGQASYSDSETPPDTAQ